MKLSDLESYDDKYGKHSWFDINSRFLQELVGDEIKGLSKEPVNSQGYTKEQIEKHQKLGGEVFLFEHKNNSNMNFHVGAYRITEPLLTEKPLEKDRTYLEVLKDVLRVLDERIFYAWDEESGTDIIAKELVINRISELETEIDKKRAERKREHYINKKFAIARENFKKNDCGYDFEIIADWNYES